MQSRLRRVVLLCVLALAPRDAGAVALTPGSYTVSMKYVRNNTVYVRLAMYSFRSDHTFRADYWEWDSGPLWDRTRSVQLIGFAYDSQGNIITPATDAVADVYGSKHFLGATGNGNENLRVRFGTWAINKGTNIKITWSDTGDIEWWKRTWHDNSINKIELFYISYADDIRGTYLRLNQTSRLFYRAFALNAGFGFGGATVGFTFGYQTVTPFDKKMVGWQIVHNKYCLIFPSECPDPSQGVDSIRSHVTNFPLMHVTATGVLREFTPRPSADKCDVYSYVAIPPGNTSMTSRRTVFQIGNECTQPGDPYHGSIINGGHFYSALQIIDANQALRGFVMNEMTFEDPSLPGSRNGMFIMSAMFLLDNSSSAAQTGIEDPNNW